MNIKVIKPPKLKQAIPVKPVKSLVAFPGKPNSKSPALDFVAFYSEWGPNPVSNCNDDVVKAAQDLVAYMYPMAPDCLKAANEWSAFMESPGAPFGESRAIQICEIWAVIQDLTGIL